MVGTGLDRREASVSGSKTLFCHNLRLGLGAGELVPQGITGI